MQFICGDMKVALQFQSGSTESTAMEAPEFHCCSNCECSVMLFILFYKVLAAPIFKASGFFIAQGLPAVAAFSSLTGWHNGVGFLSQYHCSSCVVNLEICSQTPVHYRVTARQSSILTCPTHGIWDLIIRNSMLVGSTWSKTSRLETRSCKQMPKIEWTACMWHFSNCLSPGFTTV